MQLVLRHDDTLRSMQTSQMVYGKFIISSSLMLWIILPLQRLHVKRSLVMCSVSLEHLHHCSIQTMIQGLSLLLEDCQEFGCGRGGFCSM